MSVNIDAVVRMHHNSPVPVSVADDDLNILWANAAALRRYPTLALPGGLSLLWSREQLNQMRTRLTAQREPLTVPLLLMPHLAMAFTPLEQGFLLQLCLSEEESYPPIPQSINYLTTTLTNQLRAPLSNIFASVSAIAQLPEAQEDERLCDLAVQINQNSYHMLRFTIDFTSYLRYMLGNESHSPALINLGELLNRVCHAAEVLTASVDIPLSLQLPDHPVVLEADSEQLTIALLHLLSNCCRFTREDNHIEISLSVNDDRAVIAVSDRGLGIPSNLVQRIFEPFFSYDHGGRPFAGSGLGLAIVRHIVSQHHGSVAVTSKEGEGTTVAVSLPINDSGTLTLKSPPIVADLLRDRFSLLHILLSDSCGVPSP